MKTKTTNKKRGAEGKLKRERGDLKKKTEERTSMERVEDRRKEREKEKRGFDRDIR